MDVKLTRDALALLGHIASLEHVGRTFLTTHRLYHEVIMALQRHVTDGIVAVSRGEFSGSGKIWRDDLGRRAWVSIQLFRRFREVQDYVGPL